MIHLLKSLLTVLTPIQSASDMTEIILFSLQPPGVSHFCTDHESWMALVSAETALAQSKKRNLEMSCYPCEFETTLGLRPVIFQSKGELIK